jgi:16S rRNA (uracil1498-N3)-methyltransferase
VNIILFSPQEVESPLSCGDPRAKHLLKVLRRCPGDTFDAGLINGPRGKGTLVAVGEHALTLAFSWGEPPPPLSPLHLLIGLPRPQTARAILREATSLGVAALHFIRTERGEASYASSTLWQADEWRTHAVQGAAQAFCTRLPEVTHGRSLAEAAAALPADANCYALDNYEAAAALATCPLNPPSPVALAFGAERGWSAAERDWLRAHNFTLIHLGARVLRTETAVIAAVALLKARLGWL